MALKWILPHQNHYVPRHINNRYEYINSYSELLHPAVTCLTSADDVCDVPIVSPAVHPTCCSLLVVF